MLISNVYRFPLSHSFLKFFSSFSHKHFDLFIIGAGSGGISAAKEAAKFHKKVGLANFVTPTPLGTTWGVGGTCVNVGCIPKKMMHHSASIYDKFKIFKHIGYPNTIHKELNWNRLVENVQNHIKGLNFNHQSTFIENNIDYYNKFASFIDKHTVELSELSENGSYINKEIVTADNFLIATGGRPKYSNIEGEKECVITSDDFFSLDRPPGKTLVIGASYISLECSGILNSFGFDTTIMVRSILLRGFDRKIAKRIEENFKRSGVKFYNTSIPVKYIKKPSGKIQVLFKNLTTNETKLTEEYDTVLLAIGRTPNTDRLNLTRLGVKTNNKTHKILTDKYEKTNIDNIFAIGDCADSRPELTPPAIEAGKTVVYNLFKPVKAKKKYVDYNLIPTCVFTPIEYGTVGLSEENAIKNYGENNIKIYHCEFVPVEWTIDPDVEDTCYIKVIVNVKDKERVIGFHLLSPHAGEIAQTIAVAMNLGVTKSDLDRTMSLHPTIAEEMTMLEYTSKDANYKKGAC